MKKNFVPPIAVLCAATLVLFPACAAVGDEGTSSSSDVSISESTGGISDVQPPLSTENNSNGAGTDADQNEAEKDDPSTAPMKKTVKYVSVAVNSLNIRKAASVSSASLGQAEKNTRFAYVDTEGSFYKIYYRNSVAYVSANETYTQIVESDYSVETVETVIEEGCKLLGTPYVYGAVRLHDGTGRMNSSFSVSKFDCSSLMQYIFYKGTNTILQVNTRTQIYQGSYVAKKDLRRGDLIFFTNSSRYYNTGIERVGHVALYLGDNLILHTASDFAKIEPISSKRWSYYIETRRMI